MIEEVARVERPHLAAGLARRVCRFSTRERAGQARQRNEGRLPLSPGASMHRIASFVLCAFATCASFAADLTVSETPAGSVKGTLIPSVTTSADARHVAYVARDVSKQLRLYL